MLHTLARHHPTRVTRAQLATLSRFKVTGGTFNTYLSTLRRNGLADITGDAVLNGLNTTGEVRAPGAHINQRFGGACRGNIAANDLNFRVVFLDPSYTLDNASRMAVSRVDHNHVYTRSSQFFDTLFSTLAHAHRSAHA